MEEIWKPIPGYEGYYSVSNFGAIKGEDRTCNAGRGRIRKVEGKIRITHACSKTGYIKTRLVKEGVGQSLFVHLIVLRTFIGDSPCGMQCAHIDGKRDNPRLDNLKWKTPKENSMDKIIHGTLLRGDTAPWSKLTADQVNKIRQEKKTFKELAIEYNVHASQISRIKSGKRWKHTYDENHNAANCVSIVQPSGDQGTR